MSCITWVRRVEWNVKFMLVSLYSFSSHFRARPFISRQRVSHNWREVKRRIWGIYVDTRTRPRAFSLFIPSSYFFLSCLPDSRFALPPPLAATVSSFFFPPDCSFTTGLRLRSLRGTLTRILGRQVIRRGTCWRKQSSRVNTESDERVIVNWENRVRSLVISIASDCRYLLSRRYSRGQPICFRHPTFNFAKDDRRVSAIRAIHDSYFG